MWITCTADNQYNCICYTHFEITGGPCNLIGSNWCNLFMNRTIFFYCINKIFELTKSCTWVISKWMQWSGNWTSCHVVLVWNHTCDFKSNLHCALVLFGNHAYDFSPNCTPLSSITIINHYWFQTRCNISRRMKENTAWLHNISPELDHPFCLWTPSFTSLKSNNELNVF